MTGNGCEASFWGNEKVLKLDPGDGADSVNVVNPLHCIL